MPKTHSSALAQLSKLILVFSLSACNQTQESAQPPAPEQTLETECPQINTVETVIIPSDYYKTTEKGLDLAYAIHGDIINDDTIIGTAISTLTGFAAQIEEEKSHVFMDIASNGGDVNIGLSIANAIEHYGSHHVTTLCVGNASSAASYMLLAAGKSYGYESCFIGTHAAVANHGKIDETTGEPYTDEKLQDIEESRQNTTKIVRGYYQEKLNLTDQCANFLTRDNLTLLNGTKGLKLGFLDAVFRPNGMMEVRKDDAPRFATYVASTQNPK